MMLNATALFQVGEPQGGRSELLQYGNRSFFPLWRSVGLPSTARASAQEAALPPVHHWVAPFDISSLTV